MLVALTFLLCSYTAFAHTPSPPICDDPVCNVDIQDFYFNPSSLTIRPPNTVTDESVMVVWFNHGAADHSVTSGSPSGTPDGIIDQALAPGTSFSLNITQSVYNQILAKYPSGALPYFCKFHYALYGMTATLTVTGTPIPEFSLPTFVLTLLLISVVLLAISGRSRTN